MSQHMHVLARVLVVGVPFVVFDDESAWDVFHHGMLPVFHLHGAVALVGDVVLIAYAAHEVGEPLPHAVSVELTEQGGMVETDIVARATVDIALEIFLRLLAPGIGRVVQLKDEVILAEFIFGDVLCRAQNGQLHVEPLLVVFEPLQASGSKRFMQSAPLCQYEDLAWGNSGFLVLEEREIEGCALIALAVVAGIVPVHAAS